MSAFRPIWLGLAWALVVTLAAALASTHAPRAAEPDISAEALYRQRCGICHLEGGTGTFMLARRLGADQALLAARHDLDPAFIRQVVRHGIVSMPRFSRVELPDAQLEMIVRYLAAPGPAASTHPVQ
ncbi:MAG TPA: cytochrome c [Steroidobacteraceae bacterium]|nr:cytochrome c [Steroidobacteraceae bacterium]